MAFSAIFLMNQRIIANATLHISYKTLRNGSQFSKKQSYQPFCEGAKSLDMGRCFIPRIPIKNILFSFNYCYGSTFRNQELQSHKQAPQSSKYFHSIHLIIPFTLLTFSWNTCSIQGEGIFLPILCTEKFKLIIQISVISLSYLYEQSYHSEKIFNGQPVRNMRPVIYNS